MTTYIVYKTTNIANSKIYIGKHAQRDGYGPHDFDGYLGSGVALLDAIRAYGKDNFSRETLFVFDNEDDAYAKESEIVSENFIKNKTNYNTGIGGRGVIRHTSIQYIDSDGVAWDDARSCPEVLNRKRLTTLYRYGVEHNSQIPARRELISMKLKGRIPAIHRESGERRRFANGVPDGWVEKMWSDKTWEVTAPDDAVFVVDGLATFCRENGLSKNAAYNQCNGLIKTHKGYTFKRYNHKTDQFECIPFIPKKPVRWKVTSPEGHVAHVHDIKKFCDQNDISYHRMRNVIRGVTENCDGYRCEKLHPPSSVNDVD